MAQDRYAVIGHPVAHSLSPAIHAQFAEQTAQDLDYGRIEPAADGFAEAARRFFVGGGRGLNVTVPFKGEAFDWCDRRSDRASRAGAVNTLSAGTDGTIAGDNTDGIGLVRDLRDNLGLTLADSRILVIGAGGAARGALGPLLTAAPARLVIANRTVERARALADDFADDGPIAASGFEALETAEPFDLIINASSASLAGALPPLAPGVVREGGAVYDMMYGEAAEPFVAWGRDARAAIVADGLGMLVEQAAESFFAWRGVRPETAPVLAALRAGESR